MLCATATLDSTAQKLYDSLREIAQQLTIIALETFNFHLRVKEACFIPLAKKIRTRSRTDARYRYCTYSQVLELKTKAKQSKKEIAV